ncbi:MAG: periplasmic heavy metal sensor [Pseudomonadota bacterium]
MNKRTWTFAIILIISLSLNLFIGGFLVGQAFMKSGERHRMGPSPFKPHMMRLVKQLPEDKQEAVKPIVKSYRQQFRGQIRQMHQARRAVIKALEKESLDEAEVMRLLGELRQAQDASQTVLHEHLVKIASHLPPEQREKALFSKSKRGHRSKERGRRWSQDQSQSESQAEEK